MGRAQPAVCCWELCWGLLGMEGVFMLWCHAVVPCLLLSVVLCPLLPVGLGPLLPAAAHGAVPQQPAVPWCTAPGPWKLRQMAAVLANALSRHPELFAVLPQGWQQGWHTAPVLGDRDPSSGPHVQPHVAVWRGRLAPLFRPRKQG